MGECQISEVLPVGAYWMVGVLRFVLGGVGNLELVPGGVEKLELTADKSARSR